MSTSTFIVKEINTARLKSLCRSLELCSTRANSKLDVLPHNTSLFHSFLDFSDKDFMPGQRAATELCRMGPPTAKLGLSPGCATREEVASGGQLPSQPPCQHQGGHSVSCATPGDTLHSSEQRGEGLEHTQSCQFPLGGAFGISSPPSPLSERPPRMGTHLKAQVAPNQVVPSGEMAKLIQST